MKLTDKEKQMLTCIKSIARRRYYTNRMRAADAQWLWVDTKSLTKKLKEKYTEWRTSAIGGIMSSLLRKGLIVNNSSAGLICVNKHELTEDL